MLCGHSIKSAADCKILNRYRPLMAELIIHARYTRSTVLLFFKSTKLMTMQTSICWHGIWQQRAAYSVTDYWHAGTAFAISLQTLFSFSVVSSRVERPSHFLVAVWHGDMWMIAAYDDEMQARCWEYRPACIVVCIIWWYETFQHYFS